MTAFIQARTADGIKAGALTWYAGKLRPFVQKFGQMSIDAFPVAAMRQYVIDLRESDTRYAGRPQARTGRLSNESAKGLR